MDLAEFLQTAADVEQPTHPEPLTRQETEEYNVAIRGIQAAFGLIAPDSLGVNDSDVPSGPLHTDFYRPVNLGPVGLRPVVWAQARSQTHLNTDTGSILSTLFEVAFAEPLAADMDDRPLPTLNSLNSLPIRTVAFRYGAEVPQTRQQLERARSFAELLGLVAAQVTERSLAHAGTRSAGA